MDSECKSCAKKHTPLTNKQLNWIENSYFYLINNETKRRPNSKFEIEYSDWTYRFARIYFNFCHIQIDHTTNYIVLVFFFWTTKKKSHSHRKFIAFVHQYVCRFRWLNVKCAVNSVQLLSDRFDLTFKLIENNRLNFEIPMNNQIRAREKKNKGETNQNIFNLFLKLNGECVVFLACHHTQNLFIISLTQPVSQSVLNFLLFIRLVCVIFFLTRMRSKFRFQIK